MSAEGTLKNVLRPFLEAPERWTLHFPMFVNTFCLAYHLAKGLANSGRSAEKIRANFVIEDWWRGRPTFMYRTDIEIFVGVNETIKELKNQGHDFPKKVCFTGYNQRFVFTRLDREGVGGHPLLIGDAIPAVEILKQQWSARPPKWFSRYGISAAEQLQTKGAWAREISDLFDTRRKVYAFAAPMTQLLLIGASGQARKYAKHSAATKPIPTYYVFRTNSGVQLEEVQALAGAIAQYYKLIFSRKLNREIISPQLATSYARMALTAGQPNPFPEVYPAKRGACNGSGKTDLSDRYFEILKRHHVPLSTAS